MSVSKDFSEADVIFNRASLALAKSQHLIASWLPPQPQETAAAKSEEDLDKEEADIFSPVPELLGLGAPVPAKGERYGSSSIRQSPHKEEILRRRLLGRDSHSGRNGKKMGTQPRSNGSWTTKNNLHAVPCGSESEDELGRTAFKGRNTRPTRERSCSAETALAPDQTVVAESPKVSPKHASAASPKKRPSSYLDEVLLARSEKRKKKEKPGAIRPTS